MAAGSSRRVVLVAEDDVLVRNLVRLILEEAQFQVLVAADGVEALAVSREFPGRIDVLLTDFDMPGMDGIALIEQIRKERPATGALMISGRLPDPHCVENIGVKILPKPFSPDVLVQAIRALGL